MTDDPGIDPPHLRADPQGGLSLHPDRAVCDDRAGWLWSPLGWIGAHPDRMGLLLLPRSAAGHAPPRRPRGLAGRRAGQPHHHGRAPGRARSPAGADDPHLGLHERVRLPREPLAGHRPDPQILYTPGLFLNAELDKASEDNERNALVIETARHKIGVVQIAGLVARRIVSFVKMGDHSSTGERFGLIRFGSRLDIYRAARTPRFSSASARRRSPARRCWRT